MKAEQYPYNQIRDGAPCYTVDPITYPNARPIYGGLGSVAPDCMVWTAVESWCRGPNPWVKKEVSGTSVSDTTAVSGIVAAFDRYLV